MLFNLYCMQRFIHERLLKKLGTADPHGRVSKEFDNYTTINCIIDIGPMLNYSQDLST